jgi:hypothetical protein
MIGMQFSTFGSGGALTSPTPFRQLLRCFLGVLGFGRGGDSGDGCGGLRSVDVLLPPELGELPALDEQIEARAAGVGLSVRAC